jgi:hypothetical protein
MYDQYFDEADEYTTRETLERAHALGVQSVCNDPDEAAYERLKERSPDTYDRSIIELAYEEGRAAALELEASEEDSEDIWEQLVETDIDPEAAGDVGPSGDFPGLLSRDDNSGSKAELPGSLDLPSFLRR